MKYKIIYILTLFLFTYSSLQAQTGNSSGENKEGIYTYVDEDPTFKGGDFKQYIEKNFRFTETMYKTGKPGIISVAFIVERDGSVTDVRVLKGKGLTPAQDAEAMRVIQSSSGMWKPGKINGKPVRAHFMQKFTFTPELFK